LLCFWKFRTNFLYQKIKQKETLNFEQNLEESCAINFEFCDIEILAKFSQILANVVKFYTRKKICFPILLSQKKNQKNQKKSKKKTKKKKKQRQNLPPQIKTFVTLCVFTTNKELFGIVIKFTSNK
jgi:hypothetical protein